MIPKSDDGRQLSLVIHFEETEFAFVSNIESRRV